MSDIISAGVYFGVSPMSIAGLASKEGSADGYVKDYCSHNYPQSAGTANLATLMGHSDIASQIKAFASEIKAAAGKEKPHIFGETNSGMLPGVLTKPPAANSQCAQQRREVVASALLSALAFGSWTM